MHSWNTKGGALWVSQKRGELREGGKENAKRRNGKQANSDTNGNERKLGHTNVHRIRNLNIRNLTLPEDGPDGPKHVGVTTNFKQSDMF